MKIVRCKMFSERFEYVGRDILQAGDTTAEFKFDLVKDRKQQETGKDLQYFVSFCNFYTRFIQCFKSSANNYVIYTHILEKGKFPSLRGYKTSQEF